MFKVTVLFKVPVNACTIRGLGIVMDGCVAKCMPLTATSGSSRHESRVAKGPLMLSIRVDLAFKVARTQLTYTNSRRSAGSLARRIFTHV